MGQAKEKGEIVRGQLTKREQIALGMVVMDRMPAPEDKRGHNEFRRRKASAIRALGLGWVIRKAEEKRQEFLETRKESAMFTAADRTDDLAPFEIGRNDLAWFCDQLDHTNTAGVGADELVVTDVEDYFTDLRAGRDPRAPEAPQLAAAE